MKVVLAPNAFKGSLSASAAAQAMDAGVRAALPDATTVLKPVSDGGDGFVDVLVRAAHGERCTARVRGPLDEPRDAEWGWIAQRRAGVVEMALASGLALVPDEKRDPTRTTTFGTGQLILAALEQGAERIVVGIGGSATCDGGIGMASALGYRFLNEQGHEVPPTGGGLADICRIDSSARDPRLAHVQVQVASDVRNPLCGPEGAAHVYGPQKGATGSQVRELDEGLQHLADIIRRDLGRDVCDAPGAGAAGGLGAGLLAFLDAELVSGVDLVLDLIGLDDALENADLVLTAEGAIDNQTAHGKAPAGVAARAKRAGVPCVAIAGSAAEDLNELHDAGIDAVFSICRRPMTLQDAMRNGEELLQSATEQIVRAFAAARRRR